MLVYLALPDTGAAQSGIHWAYASYFGTGRYSLDGGPDTVVLAASPRWVWRSPSISESGKRSLGFEFRLPISVGAHEFGSLDLIEEITPDSVNAVSVVPGVEIEIPMSDRWRLKSMAYLGLGTDTQSNIDAEIFRLGFRSRLRFEIDQTEMYLVNGLERIGFSASNDVSDAINLVTAGLQFSRPMAEKKLNDDPLELHWHVMYTSYFDTLGLEFSEATLRPDTLGGEWELGIAFGKRDQPLTIWRLRLDRLGIAYRVGASSDFAGVSIVFRSLFDR